MFIQTEETPNPSTLKFLPNRLVMADGTVDFPDKSHAWRHPLIQDLFTIEGVKSVFLGKDFISIQKQEPADWLLLKPTILTAIMSFFLTHDSVSLEPLPLSQNSDSTSNMNDRSQIELEIIDLLETKIRPAVAQDGGDIVFDHFKDGVVYVKMQGACAGCPSSTATLKSGIENMLRHYIPEVEAVEAVSAEL